MDWRLVAAKVSFGRGALDVRLDAEHPVWMNLPVVADLSAAGDAARRAAAPIGDVTPLVTEVRADVDAVPVVAIERRGGESGPLP